jgi:hypothetical protein
VASDGDVRLPLKGGEVSDMIEVGMGHYDEAQIGRPDPMRAQPRLQPGVITGEPRIDEDRPLIEYEISVRPSEGEPDDNR